MYGFEKIVMITLVFCNVNIKAPKKLYFMDTLKMVHYLPRFSKDTLETPSNLDQNNF